MAPAERRQTLSLIGTNLRTTLIFLVGLREVVWVTPGGGSVLDTGSCAWCKRGVLVGFGAYILVVTDDVMRGNTSVRVFAVMEDSRTAELQYASGYPYALTGGRTSLLTRPRRKPAGLLPGVSGRRLYDAKWEVLAFTFNRVKVRVDLPESAYMVFLDDYDRYWRAYVDGERRPVTRANFTFKTIYLQAGTNVVEWVYNSIGSKIAWCAYYLLLGLAIALLVWWSRSRQSSAEVARC